MVREAVEMSVSPRQKRWKPSPVPGPSIAKSKPGLASRNSSATPVTIGSTVELPETTTKPTISPGGVGAPGSGVAAAGGVGVGTGVGVAAGAQAAAAKAAATASAPSLVGDLIVTKLILLHAVNAHARHIARRGRSELHDQ
jgi:hypothetical protein